MQLSNRLTFSLASLFLIFALAFVATPGMAAEGGPTVTISDGGTTATPSMRGAFVVRFVFTSSVTGFDASGDATFQLYDKDGILIGNAADITPTAVDNKPLEYTSTIDVSSSTGNPVGFRVTVPADAATGNTLANSLGNQMAIQDLDLPPLVTGGSLVLTVAKAATQLPATDGEDYVLTAAYKTGTPPAAATPSTVPTVDHLTFDPSFLRAAVLNGATGDLPLKTGAAAADGLYDLPIVHPAGAPELMIGVQGSYIKGVKAVTVPPPVTATQNPPAASIAVSDHNPAERTFRIDVMFTPAADSLGNAGAAIKGFDSTKLDIKDASTPPAMVVTEVETERKADNSYIAILKYDLLSKPPLTVKIDQSKQKTSNPDHSRMVGESAPPPEDDDPTAEIAVSGVDVSERTFTVEVALTPGMKADGSAGDPITGFGLDDLEITGTNDSTPRIMAVDEDMANNSYLAKLQWNPLATRNLPFTVKAILDDSGADPVYYMDTSTPTMAAMAMVTSDGTTPPVDPTVDPPAKPAAPSASINANNDLIIDVMWTAVTGADEYIIKKYMGTTLVKTFPDDDPNTAMITASPYMVGPVPEADRGMSFTFTVTAKNAGGESAPSDASGAVTIPGGAVDTNNPPTFATGASIADIELWVNQAYTSGELPLATDAVGDTISYKIEPVLPAGLEHRQQDAQTYFITGKPTAVAKTAHKYIAEDQHGAMSSLDFNLTVKAPIVPTAPTLVSAMENRPENNNKIVATWTGPTGDFGSAITNYVVYVTPVGGSMMSYDTPDATMMTFTTPMGMSRGMYDVQVAAKNGVGVGAKSNKITVTVADPPGIPTNLSAALIPNTNNVTLSWQAPVALDGRTIDDGGSPITGYRIQLIQFGRVTSTRLLPATSTTAYLRGLPAGQYVFRAIAVNADGESQPSNNTSPPTIVPAVVSPPTQLPVTARIDSTISLPVISIPAKGFVILQRNPSDSGIYPQVRSVNVGLANLDHLLRDRGGMALHGPGSGNDLVFSEIMWGSDSSLADDTHSQWIELYNTTNGTLQLSNYRLEFYSARIGATAGAIDEINTINWGSLHGQRGRTRGEDTQGRFSEPVEIISMYLKINYPRVERSQARGEQLKDFRNGSNHGHWAASTRPSLNIESTWRLATPGAKPRFTVHGASTLRQDVYISEIGNSSEDGYDWIELYNATDGVINLKKWELSVVTGNGVERSLFRFPDNDSHRLPGKSFLVIASTDPKNSDNDLAAGIDITKKGIDQTGKGLGTWIGGGSNDDKNINALYTVRSFSLPNSGKMNIILRHEQGKLGKADKFEDVVGTLKVELRGPVPSNWTGYDANGETYFDTAFWPLHATGAPHGNVIDGTGNEDFRAGHVYQRNDFGKNTRSGIHEKDLSVRGWTGIGYDLVADRNNENGGTPGYHKDSLKSKASDVAGTVNISEIMIATDEESEAGRLPRATRLPQWIELYNSSLTQGVNINNWYFEIHNSSLDREINLSGTLRLPNVTIPPNQTIMIVSNSGLNSGNFSEARTINLYTNGTYRGILGLRNRGDSFLSSGGFYIELRDHENKHVDEIGNLGVTRQTGIVRRSDDIETWEIGPDYLNSEDGHRTSLIRVYDDRTNMARDGLLKTSWRPAAQTNFREVPSLTYFGNHRDFGTPGYRGGGPLPVSLSKFRPQRLDTGEVVIHWTTESELNNAGFNILRTEKRDGVFEQVNTELIKGHGTTSERNTYTWTDTTAKPNVVYYYQIQDVSLDGQVQTLRISRLKGNVSAAGKVTTTWGELKSLQGQQ